MEGRQLAELQSLFSHDLAILIPTVAYACLITMMALTAVFAGSPIRRDAALEVLRLLLRGRRNSRSARGSDREPSVENNEREGLPPNS
jgi:hypothetical protein